MLSAPLRGGTDSPARNALSLGHTRKNNREVAMKTLQAAIVASCVLCWPVAAGAADALPRAKPDAVGISSERLALIRQRIEAEIARDQLPGGVLAIARRGKLVHFEAYGFLDKTAGAPMRTDAIFNIASMTKPMIAVAALQLYEQGRLLIDDPVSKYLPQFAKSQVAVLDAKKETIVDRVAPARPITVQDLFRHTSGLVYGGRGATPVHKYYPSGSTAAATSMTASEFLDRLGAAPLLHHPGAMWDYGFGLDVLALIVEQITEQSIGRYLQENVWRPLGMNDTHFVIPADKVGRYAKALPIDPETGKPQSLQSLTEPTKFECGGGCTASTANDYLRFALMLANKGTYADQRVLGRRTVEYMTANHLGPEVVNRIGETGDPTRADYGFGLGVAVRTQPGISRTMSSVGTFAWPGASGTNWWVDPREELTVVWMAHSPGTIRWRYRQMINALVYQALAD
jgi:CubicO group peptidase (beta-lactamase class C family)